MTAAVRIANIGAAGRRRRALLGGAFLALGVGLLLVQLWAGAARGVRLAVLPLFWVGALCLVQARRHT